MPGGHIQLVALTKRFTEVAVDSIDLTVDSGEFFSLLGPSGCGKTTTLRLIAGFEQPTSGRILLDGTDMSGVPPHKRNVNTVFQSYALFPFLTVFDNVAFGLRYQKLSRAETAKRVNDALDLVQMRSYEKRRPGALSGGQQQRVALARALVLGPAVLLLDEPLGALDAKLRRSLKVELKALQERVGITFLYVTHDQEEALTMSDRLAVMNAGQIVQIGVPRADLRGARGHLRGRLPGGVQPDGSGRRGAGSRLTVLGQGRRVRARRGAGRRGRAGHRARGDPPGAGAGRAARHAGAEPGPGHGRAAGVPGRGHPGHGAAGRRARSCRRWCRTTAGIPSTSRRARRCTCTWPRTRCGCCAAAPRPHVRKSPMS